MTATANDGVARPSRQGGRVATRQEASSYAPILSGPVHWREKPSGANYEANAFRQIELAWRGFLSLRDPAGAAHTAGPPRPFELQLMAVLLIACVHHISRGTADPVSVDP